MKHENMLLRIGEVEDILVARGFLVWDGKPPMIDEYTRDWVLREFRMSSLDDTYASVVVQFMIYDSGKTAMDVYDGNDAFLGNRTERFTAKDNEYLAAKIIHQFRNAQEIDKGRIWRR